MVRFAYSMKTLYKKMTVRQTLISEFLQVFIQYAPLPKFYVKFILKLL